MPCLRVLEIVALFRKFYARPSMTCSTDGRAGWTTVFSVAGRLERPLVVWWR